MRRPLALALAFALLPVAGAHAEDLLQTALTKENSYWQLSIDRGGQVRSVRLGG